VARRPQIQAAWRTARAGRAPGQQAHCTRSGGQRDQGTFHFDLPLILLGLLFRAQLLRERLFPVAVGLPPQPIIDGGQGDVRFDELWRLLENRLQPGPGRVESARGQVDRGELKPRADFARPHEQRTIQQFARAVVVLIQFEQGRQLQVRFEIDRIQFELFLEGQAGGRGVARLDVRAAQVGVDVRQFRIQLRGFLEIRDRGFEIRCIQFGGPSRSRASAESPFRRIGSITRWARSICLSRNNAVPSRYAIAMSL